MKIKDVKYQDISAREEQNEEKSFEIKSIQQERLIDIAPGLDDEEEFQKNMYNFGEEEDLPDSDRETICRGRGINRKECLYP